ncbi:mobilization protein [Aeromonas dhakensis]|uniref:mobilization protein n=1 Tax=Aeromonas dhakensis TaxID=196024 RepID=UPI002378CBF1|nr:mobilization protein [Aeromonas dhakensis]MDD9212897.1 mobilization protein [Aeromonas dhakensis]
MTELERILLDRLERIETAHQQQTAALELQLKQQACSLSELQTVCSNALKSCETLCRELHSSFETLQNGVARSNKVTGTALGSLNSSVNDLNKALDALQRAQR